MVAAALTEKQLELVRVVWLFRREKGRPPTIRELSEIMDLSHVAVWDRLQPIIRKRVLVRTKPLASGVGRPRAFLEIPEGVVADLELVEWRKDRIRTAAVAVAWRSICGDRCPAKTVDAREWCERCRVVTEVEGALRAMPLPDKL